MSSILRGTRLLARYASIRSVHHFIKNQGNRLNLPASASFPIQKLSRNFSTDEAPVHSFGGPVKNLSELEKQLEVMDSSVRWRGRVDREDMEKALDTLRRQDQVEEQTGLMLLRCCGALMPKETPEQRMSTFSDVWELLQSKGMETKTSHYNARLRVMLENRHMFQVPEVLSEMESSPKTKPNRVTYQLLVARYCEDGDIEGAKKILQHMKNEEIPIGDAVFNSLIRGHLKLEDKDGAEEVLNTMKSCGLYPTGETYKTMIRCYAEKGDVDSIATTIEAASSNMVNIMASHVLPGVMELMNNGHRDKLDQLLLHATYPRSHEVINTMLHLVALGHDNAAVSVYELLNVENNTQENVFTGSKSILRCMILHGRSLEQLMAVSKRLSDSGRFDNDLSLLGIYALTYNQPTLALDVFKAMFEQGMAVRPHFYWPVFQRSVKNQEALYNGVASMTALADDHPDYLQTLFRTVYKPLLRSGDDSTLVITKLQENGVKTDILNSLQLLHLLRIGEFSEALTFAKSSPFKFDAELMKQVIYQGLSYNERDWENITDLLIYLKKNVNASRGSNVVENTCIMLASRRDFTPEDLTAIVNIWIEKGVTILPFSLENLKRKLVERGVDPTVIEKVEGLRAIARRRQPLSGGEIYQMSAEDLEKELSQRQPRDRDVRSLEKALLVKYASLGVVEKAEALQEKLRDSGFVFGSDLIRQMGIMTARFKKDLAGALKYIELLNTNHPDYHTYESLILRTAQLQISEGKADDAISLIKKHTELHGSPEREGLDVLSIMRGALDLVKVSRTSLKPQDTEALVDVLFDGGYVQHGMYNILTEVVYSYLDHANGDHEDLMKCLEKYERLYNKVPVYSEVLKALIKTEDTKNLQKVVDMVSTFQDEMTVLHQLALILVECNKYQHAQKVVETPGLRASMPVISQGIDRFIQGGKGEELENLVQMTKNLFGCDREEMLFSLIRYHASGGRRDATQCLAVLERFEEEGIKPRARTLRYLAKALQSAEHPVPFEIPKPGGPAAQTPLEQNALKALMEGSYQRLYECLAERHDNESMSDDFLVEVGSTLLARHSRRAFKDFTRALAESKCSEVLRQLSESEMSGTDQIYVKRQLFISQIHSGDVEKTVSEIQAFPEKSTHYVSFKAVELLKEKMPEMFSKVEEVIRQHITQDTENVAPANLLFNFYIKIGEKEKATELWQSCEGFRMKCNLRRVLADMSASKDEDGMCWLLEMARDVSPGKASSVYSQLIILKNARGDHTGALEVARKAHEEDNLPYTSLWHVAMKQLETTLLANQLEVPWQAGSFDQKSGYGVKSSQIAKPETSEQLSE